MGTGGRRLCQVPTTPRVLYFGNVTAKADQREGWGGKRGVMLFHIVMERFARPKGGITRGKVKAKVILQ